MAKNTARRVINNAPYYNDSLAYDFSMFMPREPKTNNVIEYQPKKKAKAKVKYRVDPLVVLFTVAIFAAIMTSLYLRVSICESEHVTKNIEKEVTSLQSEKTRLEYEYQSATSFANLEQLATELGMRKATKEQIVYIFPYQENKAVLEDGSVVIVSAEEVNE